MSMIILIILINILILFKNSMTVINYIVFGYINLNRIRGK